MQKGAVLFPAKSCVPPKTPATRGCLLQPRSEKNTPHGVGGGGDTSELLRAPPLPGGCGWRGEVSSWLEGLELQLSSWPRPDLSG